MLPPPTTIAICTPRAETALTCAAIAAMRSASAPYARSPMRASPDSFRRMRSKEGVTPRASLLADLEARKAPDHDVLSGARGQLGPQLLDRLAGVLVGVDVALVQQHDLLEPLAHPAFG